MQLREQQQLLRQDQSSRVESTQLQSSRVQRGGRLRLRLRLSVAHSLLACACDSRLHQSSINPTPSLIRLTPLTAAAHTSIGDSLTTMPPAVSRQRTTRLLLD